jgi:hypothetical protein
MRIQVSEELALLFVGFVITWELFPRPWDIYELSNIIGSNGSDSDSLTM